jgi:hypothetical protein
VSGGGSKFRGHSQPSMYDVGEPQEFSFRFELYAHVNKRYPHGFPVSML